MVLIARRAMLEALRDRMTVMASGAFTIGLPVLFLLTAVRSAASEAESETGLGIVLGVLLLIVAIPPTTTAIGVAAGQSAGELERGVLAPLLATPASNLALLPRWGLLFGFAFHLVVAGAWAQAAVVLALLAVDVGLVMLASRSWRREQVLARQ